MASIPRIRRKRRGMRPEAIHISIAVISAIGVAAPRRPLLEANGVPSFLRHFTLYPAVITALIITSCDATEDTIRRTDPLVPPDLTFESVDRLTRADEMPLQPPRAGWNPGLVFQGSVNNDTMIAERVLCKSIFGDAAPESDQLIIQTGERRKDFDFSLGADLANGLIPGADFEAELASLQRNKYLKVTANRAAYLYFTLEEQLKLTPTRSCLDAIAFLKQRGTFDGHVFVIPAIYAVQGVTYEFTVSTEAGTELRATIEAIVNAALKAGYTQSASATGTEIVSNDGWITLRTARPILIREWDVSGLVGPRREVIVDLENVDDSLTTVNIIDDFVNNE